MARESWSSEFDFLFSIIGFAIDLANVWRFPYIAYVNGGGAFLIPYFLMLIFGALPLFYMEVLLGQLQRESCLTVWKICPFFKGVGISQYISLMVVSFYYHILMGWSLYYIFATITANGLPWMSCGSYSTSHCITAPEMLARNMLKANYTKQNLTWPPPNITARVQLPAQEYFERHVLAVQDGNGLDNLGIPQWPVVVCTALIYILIFLCIWRGIKSSGKIVYFTATLPFIILIVLLVQGAQLKGSFEGIKYFIVPRFERLTSSQVWLDAAVQIFFSIGSGFGVHITLASYNEPNSKCCRNVMITAVANSLISLLAGFTIFTYLGYMSSLTGLPIENVASEGPGLVFQIYPMALGYLPAAPFWSIFFFFLLITLGIDSAMGAVETMISAIMDQFRGFFSRHPRISRAPTLAVILLFSFLISILNATKSGVLFFQLLDRSVGIPLLFTALGQAVAISWFYGMPQFCADIKSSCGYIPNILWRICWKVISPIFILAVIVFSFINIPPLSYRFGAYHPELTKKINMTATLDYNFPQWSGIFMWTIVGIQIAMLPLFMLIALCRYRNFYMAISPTRDHTEIELRLSEPIRKYPRYWFSFGPLTDRRHANNELPESQVKPSNQYEWASNSTVQTHF